MTACVRCRWSCSSRGRHTCQLLGELRGTESNRLIPLESNVLPNVLAPSGVLPLHHLVMRVVRDAVPISTARGYWSLGRRRRGFGNRLFNHVTRAAHHVETKVTRRGWRFEITDGRTEADWVGRLTF